MPGTLVEIRAMRLETKGATDNGPTRASCPALRTAHCGAENGMIFTVASIWRDSMRSNGRRVASVMLS